MLLCCCSYSVVVVTFVTFVTDVCWFDVNYVWYYLFPGLVYCYCFENLFCVEVRGSGWMEIASVAAEQEFDDPIECQRRNKPLQCFVLLLCAKRTGSDHMPDELWVCI